MSLRPGDVVDRFRVERVLGTGGQAIVYEVRHTQLGGVHALKVLTNSSRSVRERLLREGQAQSSLGHINIVGVTDIVDVHGSPGLIMDYVEGPTLEEYLLQNRLDLDAVDALARGLLEGIKAAHAQGVIHRDLKPANVLLDATGRRLVPKITDFGIAKVLSEDGAVASSHTKTGSTMGTPAYMSPEQIRDAKTVDARADVYSVGAILYEMVTGQRVFPGDDVLKIFAAVAANQYVPPRELVPNLPTRMEDAIVGSLVPDRERRISTCDDLLAIWLGGTPKPAKSPTTQTWGGDTPVPTVPRAQQPTNVPEPSEASRAETMEPEPAEPEFVFDTAATMEAFHDLPSLGADGDPAEPADGAPGLQIPFLKIVAVAGPLLVAGIAVVGVWTGELDPPEVHIAPEQMQQARDAVETVVESMTPEPGPTPEALREALDSAESDDLWVGAAIEVMAAASAGERVEAIEFVIANAKRRKRSALLDPAFSAALRAERDESVLLRLESERLKVRRKHGPTEYRGVPIRPGLTD